MPAAILDQLTYLSSESIITIMGPKLIGKGRLRIFNATPDQEEIPKVLNYKDDRKGLPLDGA